MITESITLLASSLFFLQESYVRNAVMVIGGVLILGIGINILKLVKIRTGNFIPAIAYAIIRAVFH